MDILKIKLSRIRSNESLFTITMRLPLDQKTSLEALAELISKDLAELNSKILRIPKGKK